LARQFSTEALGALQAAELLWQAKLAGHPSDYLEALYAALLALEPGTTLKAAQHIAQADIGYLCLATHTATETFYQGRS
jgi:DNA-binding FadR family transcriptional regulator